MKSKSQTLITGVYRTGSEYLTLMLNCHPELHASMYRVNVIRFLFRRYDPISDLDNLKNAINDVNTRLLERYGIPFDNERVFETAASEVRINYGTLYDIIMTELYIRNQIQHWAEKNQLLWREIPIFLGMMANGKAIHIIRDPRGVLASFKKYTTYRYPACLEAVFNCFDAMFTAVQHAQSLGNYVRTVRYEDLVSSPEKVISQLWQFLGLSTEHRLNKAHLEDAYGKEWYSNSSFHENSPGDVFNVARAIDGWRQNLSVDEISLTEHVCGKLMAHFGYELCNMEKDLTRIEKLIQQDENIYRCYRDWDRTGTGIERFPADPLNKLTWGQAYF